MIQRLVGAYWYNGVKLEDIKQAYFANRTLGCFPEPRAANI